MLKTTIILFASMSLSLIFSCATPYQSTSFSGGYSETMLGPDVFRVIFRGNAATPAERAQDFALLRASELTIQNGFMYFAVVDERNTTTTHSITTPGYAHTTASGTSSSSGNIYLNPYGGTYSGTTNANVNTSTTYTPPQTFVFYKPQTGLLIKAFQGKPDGICTFDAGFLQRSLRQKYGITTSATIAEGAIHNQETSKWLLKSSQAFETGNWSEVIRTSSAAITTDPASEAAYTNRAWAYYKKGLFDEAVEDCNKGLVVNKTNVLLYNYRALSFAGKGLLQRAYEDFKKALELDPSNSLTLNNISFVDEQAGDKDKAQIGYKKSCEAGLPLACENFKRLTGLTPADIPKKVEDLLQESKQLFDHADWDGVIAKTTQALRLNPQSEIAFTNRAGGFINKGMSKEALEDCNRAIQINPDYGLAYNNRAYANELLGKKKAAILDYEIGCNLKYSLACNNLKRVSAIKQEPNSLPLTQSKQ